MIRKIFALIPAVLSTVMLVYLTVMIGDIVPLIALITAAFIASGIAECFDKSLISALLGLIPAAVFLYEGLTPSDPANDGTLFIYIAVGILLYYLCLHLSVFVYRCERDKQ